MIPNTHIIIESKNISSKTLKLILILNMFQFLEKKYNITNYTPQCYGLVIAKIFKDFQQNLLLFTNV